MTGFGNIIGSLVAAGVVAAGGLLAGDSATGGFPARTVLVIDAAAGDDGRALLDARLRETDAEVRLPRTPAEARTNLRYFAAQGYRVVVTGPRASAAARVTGTAVVRTPDLASALAASRR